MTKDPWTDEQRAVMEELYGAEDLHPNLLPYVEELDSGFTALRHPYVYMLFYTPALNKMANKQYQYKVDALENAFDAGDWYSYVFLHERPYRSQALVEIMDEIVDDSEYWDLVQEVWLDTENLHQWGEHIEILLEADRPGRWEHLMSDDERQIFGWLAEPLPIYRGFNADEGSSAGWSWTLNPTRAQWFARRFVKHGFIAHGTVPKKDVIAYLSGRGEQEIIVNPDHVTIFKTEEVKGDES